MSKIDFTAFRTARVATVSDGGTAFDPVRDGTRSPPPTRVGTVAFWFSVLCLIAARVAFFDPSAHRPVGAMPQASLAPEPVALTR